MLRCTIKLIFCFNCYEMLHAPEIEAQEDQVNLIISFEFMKFWFKECGYLSLQSSSSAVAEGQNLVEFETTTKSNFHLNEKISFSGFLKRGTPKNFEPKTKNISKNIA